MSCPITFTLDLEDHRPVDMEKRYPATTLSLLDFLDEHAIKATVFILGRVAAESPELIRTIADRGHELAYHTEDHVHLHKLDRAEFCGKSENGKKFIEDITGQPVTGFRAPAFSLTQASLWAVDAIQELGFVYSSSVLPIANPINGFPGAPRQPFYWPNGLLEIPACVARFGPLELPFLGGIYLRYLPYFLISRKLKRAGNNASHWIYCHPHDFDHEEPYYTIPGTSVLTSLLLWFNRKPTLAKLDRLMSEERVTADKPFNEQIQAGKFKACSVFNPAS